MKLTLRQAKTTMEDKLSERRLSVPLNPLCHITAEYNAQSILDMGLCAGSSGYIYLFEDGTITLPSGESMPMSDAVALSLSTIQTHSYFKFSVDPKGITTPIEHAPRNVFAAGYHWRICQPHINKEFIRLIDWRSANKQQAIELRNKCMADKLGIPYRGQSYQQLNQLISERLNLISGEATNQLMKDTWEHADKPYRVELDNDDLLHILRLRSTVLTMARKYPKDVSDLTQ